MFPNHAPAYSTQLGGAYCGDALDLLAALPAESIDLVMTSPPFALLREKAYGNRDQSETKAPMRTPCFLLRAM